MMMMMMQMEKLPEVVFVTLSYCSCIVQFGISKGRFLLYNIHIQNGSFAHYTNLPTTEMPRKRYPGEAKGFVEEMRFVAMKLHTKEQAKEGEKEFQEPQEESIRKWEPTVDGYLKFLVDSKLVYDTLETMAVFPSSLIMFEKRIIKTPMKFQVSYMIGT